MSKAAIARYAQPILFFFCRRCGDYHEKTHLSFTTLRTKLSKVAALVFALLLAVVALSACGTIITVPIDSTPASKDKATLILYNEQGFTDDFQLVVDKQVVGHISPETPLKVQLEPGSHEMYIEVPTFMLIRTVIRRITVETFEAGKVYYRKLVCRIIPFASDVKIEPSEKITSYTVRSHNQ